MNKVILLVGLVTIQRAVCEEQSTDSIAKSWEALKKDDKEDFLSYVFGLSLLDWAKDQPRPPKFLPMANEELFFKTLNIPQEKIREFQKINIPKESRKKLLIWVKNEFGLNAKDVLNMIKTKQCQGPNCINVGDLGPLCCPW